MQMISYLKSSSFYVNVQVIKATSIQLLNYKLLINLTKESPEKWIGQLCDMQRHCSDDIFEGRIK